MGSVIIGTGSDLPEWELTNDDLEAMGVGYDRARAGGKSLEQWAMERIGVHSRHRVRPGEGVSDMATRASRRALADAGLQASDLDLLLLSTTSGDQRVPSTASVVQANLGAACKFFQIDAACPGFVDSLIAADALLKTMRLGTALVVAADASSLFCGPDNFMLHALFGDAAGAVILRREAGSRYGLQAYLTAGEGRNAKIMWVRGGAAREPLSPQVLAAGRHTAVWKPKEIYLFAVEKLTSLSREVTRRAGWTLDEVDWFIPHQTGRNIILDSARALGQSEEKFIINIDHTGNTTGATIPTALDEANRAGQFRDGDKIVLAAMGAGLGWGAVAMVWREYGRANGRC